MPLRTEDGSLGSCLPTCSNWSDPKRKKRRRFHANGDGVFVVDGTTIDLKKKMAKWKPLP